MYQHGRSSPLWVWLGHKAIAAIYMAHKMKLAMSWINGLSEPAGTIRGLSGQASLSATYLSRKVSTGHMLCC